MITEKAAAGIVVLLALIVFWLIWVFVPDPAKFRWPCGRRSLLIPFLDERMYREFTKEVYVPNCDTNPDALIKDVKGESIIEREGSKE